MESSLDAVEGALKGSRFLLIAGETSLGRDPSNDITILDSLVSRRHCAIRGDGGLFTITNLDGGTTFVNGAPVHQRVLKPGDEIRIGNSVFRLQPAPDGSIAPPAAAPACRATSDLNALVRVAAALHSARQVEAIGREIAACALDIAPARRAAVAMMDDNPEESAAVIALDQCSRRECAMELDERIVRRVVEEGVAVVSNETGPEEGQRLLALAIPVEIFGQARCVLYLDGMNLAARFDSGLFQVLAALRSIATIALENALRREVLEGDRRPPDVCAEHNMIGNSAPMVAVYRFISKVAPSDSTVLVCGESGTGKELVARAVHANSGRRSHPFVAINCAAITETLLESELFGHEKGAFTGAVSQKRGKLEVAEGGTVFLDEIGELAPALQAKLLRVSQEREFERVGGTRPVKLNVRIIAATNKDLQEAVKNGSFRQDLYYRLNVVSIRMPALRERREDIPLLASYFAAKYGERSKRTITGLAPAVRARLMDYDWPGNVRELENAIERAVVLGSTTVILPEDLPEAVLDRSAPSHSEAIRYHVGVLEAKKRIILQAMEQSHGHYTEAARLLGVHPNYLHRLMRNLNLKEAWADVG